MSIRYSFKAKTWTALLFHTQPVLFVIFANSGPNNGNGV